jgi:hypothetical protein
LTDKSPERHNYHKDEVLMRESITRFLYLAKWAGTLLRGFLKMMEKTPELTRRVLRV